MLTLYAVVPCYNEEEVLPQSAEILREKWQRLMTEGKISPESRIALVDDGSKDRTWPIIAALCAPADSLFCAVKLSHNRGHQNALLAGLETCMDQCDAIVSLDADLQDDIDVIDQFVEQYEAGCDIVYGVRSDRSSDHFAKRFTAQSYYKLLKLLGVDILYNHVLSSDVPPGTPCLGGVPGIQSVSPGNHSGAGISLCGGDLCPKRAAGGREQIHLDQNDETGL